jgi:hypothetical protein
MDKDKNNPLSSEDVIKALAFFVDFPLFEIFVLPEDEYDDYAPIFEKHGADFLDQFKRIMVCTVFINGDNYESIVKDFGDEEWIDDMHYIKPLLYEDQLFIFEVFRLEDSMEGLKEKLSKPQVVEKNTTKKKTTKKKTRSEIELDLADAIAKEEYELAAKLDKKLKRMKK